MPLHPVCDLHRAVLMLRGRVERVELEWSLASVPDVVARAGRHDDRHVALDFRRPTIDEHLPLPVRFSMSSMKPFMGHLLDR